MGRKERVRLLWAEAIAATKAPVQQLSMDPEEEALQNTNGSGRSHERGLVDSCE